MTKEIHHSPSRATNPEVLRVYRSLVLWECFSEDVRSHILSGAVLDVDVPSVYGLTNKMKADVNMLSASMVVIISSEV